MNVNSCSRSKLAVQAVKVTLLVRRGKVNTQTHTKAARVDWTEDGVQKSSFFEQGRGKGQEEREIGDEEVALVINVSLFSFLFTLAPFLN